MASLARTIVVLTASESKRLIARAVAQLPEVQCACEKGRLIIGSGTTNAYVAEELLGTEMSKWGYAAGVVADGRLGVTQSKNRVPPVALKLGQRYEGTWIELLQEFERDDVFIKGGNAIDTDGNVGVLLGSDIGGTVGQMFGILAARGSRIISPVGLEKLVPDVIEAARHCGTTTTVLTDGIPVGMAVMTQTELVTELEALESLCGVSVWHIASGGVAGAEGAVTFAVEGAEENIRQAVQLLESIAGEPPVVRD